MTTTTTTNGKPQATFNQRQYSTWLQINRSDGTEIECSVAHGPLVGKPQFGIFISVPEDENGDDDSRFAEDETLTVVEAIEEPNLEQTILSAQEARLLKDFLNHPEVAALLDQA